MQARREIVGDAPRRSRARYGGAWFETATALRLSAGLSHPRRFAALLAEVLRHPNRFRALLALLLRTPSELVPLSSSPSGLALREYFAERFWGAFPQNRLCRGVLLLPDEHAVYLRGRRRQALRTNLRHATAAGIRCESGTDLTTALDAGRAILADRATKPDDFAALLAVWRQVFSNSETTLYVARGSDTHPLAVIGAVIDSHLCLIRVAIASHHGARWALHDHLVQELIGRRVRYLLAEGEGPFGALGFEPELHHYQRLLGYELRHLIPCDAGEVRTARTRNRSSEPDRREQTESALA